MAGFDARLPERLETACGPSQPSASGIAPEAFAMPPGPTLHPIDSPSADHEGQKPQKARPLDGCRQLALLLGRNRSDAARHDLAAFGDIPLQQLHILVIDLGRI